jgi:hypothetical protein
MDDPKGARDRFEGRIDRRVHDRRSLQQRKCTSRGIERYRSRFVNRLTTGCFDAMKVTHSSRNGFGRRHQMLGHPRTLQSTQALSQTLSRVPGSCDDVGHSVPPKSAAYQNVRYR